MWTWLLTLFSWAHLQLVEPIVRWWEEIVLGSWEEWLLALVRQGFEEATRFLNALGTWFLSLFSKRSYRKQLRLAWQENSWQQWWGEVATRPSTLNALVANLVAQQQQQQKKNDNDVPSGALTHPVQAVVSPPGGLESLSTTGGGAWWPRPIRQRTDSIGRLRQQGVSLSARLERPVVFVQQSGMGILDELAKRRHGLIEDAKMAAQLTVSRCFDLARSTVRAVFFLPARDSLAAGSSLGRRGAGMYDSNAASASDSSEQGGSAATCGGKRAGVAGMNGVNAAGLSRSSHKAHLPRSKSAHFSIAEMAYQPGAGAGSASASMARRGLIRSRSYGRLHTGASAFVHHATEAPSDALSVIRAAGYPHELHTVTTDDGYVLRLERIPRPGARDVVFFMHGVLDTSMAWVSGGVTGSQAFGAWEAGMDVWLGNSRGNAPRQHQDPSRRGWRYWQYNINHMGMYDIAAQLDHIHNVKCAELGAGTVTLDLDSLGPLAGRFFGGAGGRSVGKRTANSAAGTGLQLLPGRTVSTLASPGLSRDVQGQAAHAGAAGSRGTNKMRQSNSDSNLYRWGSCNSGASSGGGRVGLLDFNSSSAGSGVAAPYDSTQAASTLLAPATPQQLSPQQQYLATANGGSASVVSAASLGRPASSHELLSTVSSCGDSEDAEGEGDQGSGDEGTFGAVEPSLCSELRGLRQTLQLEPSGAVASGSDAAGGAAIKHDTGRRRVSSGGTAPVADGGTLATVSWTQPASSHSSVAQSSLPMSSVCRNAVTLTVMASAAEEPTDALAGTTVAGVARPPAPTTFTLEAKTRRDFGPSAATVEPPAPVLGQAPPSAASTEKPHQQLTVGRLNTDAGSVAGGGGGAASVLEVMNSVLGPAADAVTQAVASAGAAIATAAASATHLLRPAPSPQRISAAGSSLTDLGAAGPSASAPQLCASVSPFAAPESQASATADVASVSAAQLGGERPTAVDAAASPASQGVWLPGPAAPGAQLEAESGLQDLPAPSTGGSSSACAAGPLSAVPIASTAGAVGGMARRKGTALPAATAPAAAPVVNEVRHQSSPRLQGTSFRRACSSGYLADAGGSCTAGNVANGFGSGDVAAERAAALTPARLAESERSTSGVSAAASSRSSTSEAAASAAAREGWGENPEVAPHQDRGLAGSRGVGSGGGIRRTATASVTSATSPCPYKLRCVAHSLGGMSVLIHLINRLREGRPHHVNRLLLLTPAGFHQHCPRAAKPIMWALPIVTRMIRTLLGRSFCFPLYIPTPLGRALTFKLLLSASRIPGLGELLRLGFKALLDGDISQWDRALQMPHYSAEDMPAISVDQVLHLTQLVFSDAFRLYDYGSPAANLAHYGCPSPPDVSAEYWRLDLPVHLVGGRRDGIIPPPNIHRHLEAMRAQGVAVSYREFDFGHLDFTFGVKEELRMYLMKVLRL